jgi:hypothetical protein
MEPGVLCAVLCGALVGLQDTAGQQWSCRVIMVMTAGLMTAGVVVLCRFVSSAVSHLASLVQQLVSEGLSDLERAKERKALLLLLPMADCVALCVCLWQDTSPPVGDQPRLTVSFAAQSTAILTGLNGVWDAEPCLTRCFECCCCFCCCSCSSWLLLLGAGRVRVSPAARRHMHGTLWRMQPLVQVVAVLEPQALQQLQLQVSLAALLSARLMLLIAQQPWPTALPVQSSAAGSGCL